MAQAITFELKISNSSLVVSLAGSAAESACFGSSAVSFGSCGSSAGLDSLMFNSAIDPSMLDGAVSGEGVSIMDSAEENETSSTEEVFLVDKVSQQVWVNDLELTSKNSSGVNVGSVRLETLVVSKNLRSRSGRHWCNQKRVSQSVLLDLGLQGVPVPKIGRFLAPQVELQDTLRSWRSFVGLVLAILNSQLHGGFQSTVVDGLEDLDVQLSGFVTVERQSQLHESISETLDTNSNWSVTHVGSSGLWNRVIVSVNDLVEVLGDNLGDLVQLLKVVPAGGLVVFAERRQRNRGQVTNSNLLWRRVLDNLTAQVGRLDHTQVLLVGLGVTGVLFLELVTVDVSKTWGFRRREQSPVGVLLDSLHEQVWDPQSREQVSSSDFLLTVVLTDVDEIKDVGMPWLDIQGKGTRTLVTTLVNVSGGVVKHSHHRNHTVRSTVGTGDVRTSGSDIMDVQTNTTSCLGDQSTSLKRVINSVDRVLLHCDQETRGHLRVGGTRVEKGWRRVSEELLGHQVVGLDDLWNVVAVNTNGNTHNHVLRSFSNFSVNLEQVRPFQSLETKIVVREVSVVHDCRVELFCVLLNNLVSLLGNHWRVLTVLWVHVSVQLLHDLGELLGGLLVQVGDGDSGSQGRIIRVDGGHVSGSLCSEVVELDGGDAMVNTRNDSLGDGNGFNVLRVEAVTQTGHSGGDFVEADWLFAPVSFQNVHCWCICFGWNWDLIYACTRRVANTRRETRILE
ncbi:hypothetical protein OGAPHI_006472 [Ogataea philodendri]|uniref:Uncharacterized protein n=1 Tax=Ogataea philodendri TaxID=1378263 RepID=A0A9P8T0C2_9ASCO|nr:uncharacterized protein OGAPHI_006472 [Ogataea philodendri]KAH3661623.1 hypothetical protein OGAPHI_006472 [Ogataea philodendri]